MRRTKAQLTQFKVRQAIGSMAIEGIRVSPHVQELMLQIAEGRVEVAAVKEGVVAKYKQPQLTMINTP